MINFRGGCKFCVTEAVWQTRPSFFLSYAPAFVVFSSATLAHGSTGGFQSSPHILMIIADDLGFNDVGFHGSKIDTSFLNELSRGGVHFVNYYGHSICTPSRASLMTGRYASHTGLQHSYIETGTRVGLPLKFKTIGNHLKELGYESHYVGKWHLGFQNKSFTPLRRGFDTFYGFLGGGEDYLTHKAGDFLDFHDGDTPIFDVWGIYSAKLFTDKTVSILESHHARSRASVSPPGPWFVCLSLQSVHDPLQVPADYEEAYEMKYKWISHADRRKMAGMVDVMDIELRRVADKLKELQYWKNTLILFLSDNGGAAHVANSNYPMRGGKWTAWEGGTHLAAFAFHGGGLLPPKNFTGLFHHCDWVPTLVAAAGGLSLNDPVRPPPDGFNQWLSLVDSVDVIGKRDHVIIHVDQTNQKVENDPGGWSGYAAVRVGRHKLILGNPGQPDGWCWPDEPRDVSALAENMAMDDYAMSEMPNVLPNRGNIGRRLFEVENEETKKHTRKRKKKKKRKKRKKTKNKERAGGMSSISSDAADSSYGRKLITACRASSEYDPDYPCTNVFDGNFFTDWATKGEGVGSWIKLEFGEYVRINLMKYANRKGDERNKHVQLMFSDGSSVSVRLHNDNQLGDFVFASTTTQSVKIIVESVYSSMNNGAKEIEFWYSDLANSPMPDPWSTSCHFGGGKVPVNKSGALLFDIEEDPGEHVDIAGAHPEIVTELRRRLEPFLKSAVAPLNELPEQRLVDPQAVTTARYTGAWVPWEHSNTDAPDGIDWLALLPLLAIIALLVLHRVQRQNYKIRRPPLGQSYLNTSAGNSSHCRRPDTSAGPATLRRGRLHEQEVSTRRTISDM